ncbi:hypothetical protein NDU88_001450 [Pleurodeles waltl]|uniref:Uncharacterized protein n=1 Tax=Pleurodeles waltl TaxID=8319 RepID=A0AAV7P6Q0_PLEWA|nr:hypothetical protein NDU88_001450 [Pleurodeles waltl]
MMRNDICDDSTHAELTRGYSRRGVRVYFSICYYSPTSAFEVRERGDCAVTSFPGCLAIWLTLPSRRGQWSRLGPKIRGKLRQRLKRIVHCMSRCLLPVCSHMTSYLRAVCWEPTPRRR